MFYFWFKFSRQLYEYERKTHMYHIENKITFIATFYGPTLTNVNDFMFVFILETMLSRQQIQINKYKFM